MVTYAIAPPPAAREAVVAVAVVAAVDKHLRPDVTVQTAASRGISHVIAKNRTHDALTQSGICLSRQQTRHLGLGWTQTLRHA